MTALLELTVEGDPVPKGRPRIGRGRAYTPKRTRDAEQAIGLLARLQLRSAPPTTLPVHVDVRFFTRTARRVDVDNLVKLALDSLNGIAWADDNQVVSVGAIKAVDRDRPRTEIRVFVGAATA